MSNRFNRLRFVPCLGPLSLLVLAGTVFALMYVATVSAAEPGAKVWQVGWPHKVGPLGNLLPLESDTPLIEDLSLARLAWVSETDELGTAKTGSQTFRSAEDILRRLGPERGASPGNWGGVIVVNGTVYASSWRPTGAWFKATATSGRTKKPLQVRYRLDAEDTLIAIDAQTGKTKWIRAVPGGWIRGGGKRGGLQVTPAAAGGRVFSLGSTGRLFAHDAKSGKLRWRSDIGPAHASMAEARAAALKKAGSGTLVTPTGAGLHCSLLAVADVVVAPNARTGRGSRDIGLRGHDAATGELRWELESVISRHATANIWMYRGTPYLLCAGTSGTLSLIDPSDGNLQWQVTGLGPNFPTLSPGREHVLVNVKPETDKYSPGLWGCYRISPQGAKRVWTLPDKPEHYIPIKMDSCARMRYLIRDGLAYIVTNGWKTADARGKFLICDVKSGKILAQHTNTGRNEDQIGGLTYLVGDRLLVRRDNAHGATHGGRHPMVLWRATRDGIHRLDDAMGICGLDLVDFDTAYEVNMETPLVDGRLFERTDDGRLACYDLRKFPDERLWELDFEGAWQGLPSLPVVLRRGSRGQLLAGKVYPPEQAQAGIIYGSLRRFAKWETIDGSRLTSTASGVTGTIGLQSGTGLRPVQIEIRVQDEQLNGTWSRQIPALKTSSSASGKVEGSVFDARVYPTPWFKEQPWTTLAPLPTGTKHWTVFLRESFSRDAEPRDLVLSLDHDGKRVTRAAVNGLRISQSWHEATIDALRIEDDRLTGTATILLHGDRWVALREGGGPIAGKLTIDAAADGDSISGSYQIEWGVPFEARGKISGTILRP
jgi:outer membrane protein assembly factor BamB